VRVNNHIRVYANGTVFWIVKPCSLVGIHAPAIWRNFLPPPSWWHKHSHWKLRNS